MSKQKSIAVRDFIKSDKDSFIKMAESFYSSDAVSGAVSTKNIENAFLECIKQSPFLRGFIIEFNDEIAGFAIISFSYSLEAGGLVVLIEDLFVLEKFRGKGLVSAFFEKLFSFYNKKAARYRLEVTKNNKTAIDIYKHYGFKPLDYMAMVKEV